MFVAQRKDAALDEDDLRAAARTLEDSEKLVDVSRLGRSVFHTLGQKRFATYIPEQKNTENT